MKEVHYANIIVNNIVLLVHYGMLNFDYTKTIIPQKIHYILKKIHYVSIKDHYVSYQTHYVIVKFHYVTMKV